MFQPSAGGRKRARQKPPQPATTEPPSQAEPVKAVPELAIPEPQVVQELQDADIPEIRVQQPDHSSQSLLDHLLPGFTDLSDNPALFDGSTSDSPTNPLLLADFGDYALDMTMDPAPGDDVHDIHIDQSQAFWPETQTLAHSTTPSFAQIAFTTPTENSESKTSDRTITPQRTIVKAKDISPAKSLMDPASVLVEFYFKETAQLFSCYDSSMNPFRTTVSRLWDSSPLIYRTVQSMAAASLMEDFPPLGAVGKRLRGEAIAMLDDNAGSELDRLLAMLMLGGSASWHDPRDLGLRFFNQARRKLATMPACAFDQEIVNYHFFHQSMTYWEMLLAYVAEDEELDASDKSLLTEGCSSLHFVPHPWTGFARDTQHAVQMVGRLIRQQRKLAFSHRFTSYAHIKQLERDLAKAKELEQYLLNLSHPLEMNVLDPKDGNTPVWHLLTLAEVYRSTGLIQLYHIFPDLLDARLAQGGNPIGDADVQGKTANPDAAAKRRNDWLTSYALQVLNMIKLIPLESGTRDFQPFVLVSLSSELRAPPLHNDDCSVSRIQSDINNSSDTADQMMGIDTNAIEVSRMRRFIQSRLNSFLHILPPKPISVCLDVVQETWKRMDKTALTETGGRRGSCEDRKEIYWMDVMIENGWETTMA